jgi:hypothetical protein
VRWARQRRARGRLQGGLSAVSDWFPRRTSGVVAYGKTVWSWHPLLVPSFAKAKGARPGSAFAANSRGDGGKTNSSPGRARHKPSNHCAGKAGVSRLRLWSFPLCICALLRRTGGHGCQSAPGLPCTLSIWMRGKRSTITWARRVARTRRHGCLAPRNISALAKAAPTGEKTLETRNASGERFDHQGQGLHCRDL